MARTRHAGLSLLLILTLFLVLPISVSATAISITIYGTNASNAQSNITKYGANNSVNISAWNIDSGIKTFRVNSLNDSGDEITFNISNVTAYRVVELRVNSTAVNAYQATANGMVNFTYSASQGNKTYDVRPATNVGGYNTTWAQFWTWPSLFGSNFTSYFLPYSGATSDLNMNGKNITNVATMNITTTNVTVLNATDIKGNGSGIYSLNSSNITWIGNLTIDTNTFFIDATNNRVGIGTTGPAVGLHIGTGSPNEGLNAINDVYIAGKLEVDGVAFFADTTTFRGDILTAVGTQNWIRQRNDGYGISFGQGNDYAIGYIDSSDALQFVDGTTIGSNVRMVINNQGDVGIGTTSPSGKLNVVGNTNISGYLSVADNITRVVNVTANYTVGTTNATKTMFTCYADSGTLNLTLPTGVSGKEFTIKKKDSTSNICEIYSNQNIDGALRANISVQYNSIDLVYTDEWSIV